MHAVNSCQNTSCQYSSTNPTPCKSSQRPWTCSFSTTQWLVQSSHRHNIQIPNSATQHRQAMASYFVISFSVQVAIILFRKEQQQFHYILKPMNVIIVLTLCVEQGFFLFELLLFFWREKNRLWQLANLFSHPQLIPEVKLLPHKLWHYVKDDAMYLLLTYKYWCCHAGAAHPHHNQLLLYSSTSFQPLLIHSVYSYS